MAAVTILHGEEAAIDPEVLEALRRDSGLTVTADGTWRYRDARVPNPRVQDLFHRGLAVRDDGEVVLHVGRLWCYVHCETVARFVDGVRIDPADGTFAARLRHGVTVNSGTPPIVGIDPEARLYVWLPGEPVAAVARGPHSELVGRLEEGADGELRLVIGDHHWPVAALEDVPSPTARPPG